jgi:hypothetical protein
VLEALASQGTTNALEAFAAPQPLSLGADSDEALHNGGPAACAALPLGSGQLSPGQLGPRQLGSGQLGSEPLGSEQLGSGQLGSGQHWSGWHNNANQPYLFPPLATLPLEGSSATFARADKQLFFAQESYLSDQHLLPPPAGHPGSAGALGLLAENGGSGALAGGGCGTGCAPSISQPFAFGAAWPPQREQHLGPQNGLQQHGALLHFASKIQDMQPRPPCIKALQCTQSHIVDIQDLLDPLHQRCGGGLLLDVLPDWAKQVRTRENFLPCLCAREGLDNLEPRKIGTRCSPSLAVSLLPLATSFGLLCMHLRKRLNAKLHLEINRRPGDAWGMVQGMPHFCRVSKP